MPLSSVARPLKWISASVPDIERGGVRARILVEDATDERLDVAVHRNARLHHLLFGRDRAARDKHGCGDKGRAGH